MSESPDAIRKYIAPRPSAVTVSRTNVLTANSPRNQRVDRSFQTDGRPEAGIASDASRRLRRSADAEMPAHERRVVEELAGGAGMDDAALVEHDDVAGEPVDD